MPLEPEQQQDSVDSRVSKPDGTEPVSKDSHDQTLTTARDEDMDGVNAEDVVLARPEWGSVAMLAAAASFGSGVPGAIASAYAELFRSVELNGDFSISNGGGPIGLPTREEIAARKEEEDHDWTDRMLDMKEEQEKRELREREEWSQSIHSYAGVEITGAEWLSLASKFKKGGALHDWLVDQMQEDGEAPEDAESLADLVALRMEMNGTPPSLWTDQMKEADRYLKDHPDIEKKVQIYTKRAETESTALDAKTQQNVANDISTEKSAVAGSDLFASAPDLKEHHEAALAAKEPLDVSKQPMKLAQTSMPAQSPGSGFDI